MTLLHIHPPSHTSKLRQYRADRAGVGWTWQRDPLSPWRSVTPGRIKKHCLPLGGVSSSNGMTTCHYLHPEIILRPTLASPLRVAIGGILVLPLCCRPHVVIEGVFLGEWSGSHSRHSTCAQEWVALLSPITLCAIPRGRGSSPSVMGSGISGARLVLHLGTASTCLHAAVNLP